MTEGRRLDPSAQVEPYQRWIEYITANHQATDPRMVEAQQFTPLVKPLSESKVALVGSAGVHLDDQQPFHVETVAGDASHRLLPDDLDMGRLRFTHTHYDTTSAESDPNVVFPLDRLHDAVAEGRIGSTAAVHIGMMGFNPDPGPVADETAPAIAEILTEEGVDVVVLVPG